MRQNNNHRKRMFITVGVIVTAALIGLMMIDINPVRADRTQTVITENATTETNSAAELAGGIDSGLATGAVLKMVSALVVVIVCVYLGVFLLKKLTGRRYNGGSGGGHLQVMETAYLGPRKMVSLIKVANKAVLIGVTEEQINVLSELSETETAELLASEETAQPQESFVNVLKSAAGRLRIVTPKRAAISEN